jgi:hypothetical protein
MTPPDSVRTDPAFETFELSDGDAPTEVPYTNASAIGTEHARATWALAAREQLIDTAGSYQAVITYKELADSVQARTRIRTDQLRHYWVGDVLGRVARDCTERGEPLLSSLCVDASGSVGTTYAAVVLEVRGKAPKDSDDHAATERLACYKHFGATLPHGGGTPALTSQLSAKRTRDRKAAAEDKPLNVCPIHFTTFSVTGVCDQCE